MKFVVVITKSTYSIFLTALLLTYSLFNTINHGIYSIYKRNMSVCQLLL